MTEPDQQLRVPTVADGVLALVEQHVKADVSREVGGVFVGNVSVDGCTITAALPALRAEAERAHVTFTHEVWEDLLAQVDHDHEGQHIVGWYHSHPGFGVFLSEYDQFIQTNFFADPALCAYVVDPIAGTTGWFGSVGDEVRLLETSEIEPTHLPVAESMGMRNGQSGTPRSTLVLLAVVGGIFALALGYVAFNTGRHSPQTEVMRLQEQARQAEESHPLEAAGISRRVERAARHARSIRAPVFLFKVESGDTLWGIASAYSTFSGYDVVSMLDAILAENQSRVTDPMLLRPGTLLAIPAVDGPRPRPSPKATDGSHT